MLTIETRLGDLIATMFEASEEFYGDADCAVLATQAALGEVLSKQRHESDTRYVAIHST